ncbi:hypothetical protein ERUR111494_00995 [Erysipelothrix urinaevulpis]|uniref:hypothetical protein n=1 Tax=Erysipelothrix urinaevulpis TaxID=2683717 RepID=UPI001356C736|nr:hypothetical protein [Erysipelothrix urinaevulpis]
MQKRLLKHILYFSAAAVLVGFLFIVLHDKFQTKTVALESRNIDQVMSEQIDVDYLSDYLKDHEDDLVLLIKDDSQDSEYVIQTILSPLANEQEEQALPQIVEVNVPKDSDISVTRLKTILEIERYPAFVHLSSTGESYKIISTKVYDPQKPFTSTELKTWFFENNLWSGPYGVRD